MRDTSYILTAFLITGLAVFLVVPAAGFDIKLWKLAVSATIGGLFAGLLVLLGETIIEDVVKMAIVLVLGGILWATKPGLGYIFISALLSAVIGALTNQINQYAADKRIQTDRKTAGR